MPDSHADKRLQGFLRPLTREVCEEQLEKIDSTNLSTGSDQGQHPRSNRQACQPSPHLPPRFCPGRTTRAHLLLLVPGIGQANSLGDELTDVARRALRLRAITKAKAILLPVGMFKHDCERACAAFFVRNVVGALMCDPLGLHLFPELSKEGFVGSPDKEGPFGIADGTSAKPIHGPVFRQ